MKPNKIYVFIREDGTLWADYSLGGTQVSIFTIDTKEKAEKVAANPGENVPERVRSLVQRKLMQLGANEEQELPPISPKKPWWKFWS